MLLVPLDRTFHDIDGFSSGVIQCDEDLRSQARKLRNKCLVMADGQTIQAFGRYNYKTANLGGPKRKVVWIDYLACDQHHGRGAGMEMLLRLLIRIHKDPRSHQDDIAAVMIDSLDCGVPEMCARRWAFFTEKAGLAPSEGFFVKPR